MKPTNSMKINTKTGKNIFKKILNKINPSRLSSAILSSFKVTCSYLVTFQFKPSNKSWKSHFWNFFHRLWKKCHWIQLVRKIFDKKTEKTFFFSIFLESQSILFKKTFASHTDHEEIFPYLSWKTNQKGSKRPLQFIKMRKLSPNGFGKPINLVQTDKGHRTTHFG